MPLIAAGCVAFLVACGDSADGFGARSDRETLASKLDELQLPDGFVLIDEAFHKSSGLFVTNVEAHLNRDYRLRGTDIEGGVADFIEANTNLEQTSASEGIYSFRNGDYQIALLFDSRSTDPGEQLPEGVMVRISIALVP